MDIALIIAAAGITVFSAFKVYAGPVQSAHVLIKGSGREWVFPIDAEETVAVPGPLGNTVVRISNNEAWVEQSPCVNQTCAAQGHVNKHGAWAACLPNGVFILIEGAGVSQDEPDAMAW